MSRILLGLGPDGRRLYLPGDLRQQTHMHIIGGTRTGKSKFLEHLIRQDIHEGHGLCLVDWHGTLYNDILRWCWFHDIGLAGDYRSLILLNPSQPNFVSGFNPFMNQGQDVSTQVSRRIDATIRPWGVANTNEMPTFERTCRAVYTFAVELKETLPNSSKLLDFDQGLLRTYAIDSVSDPYGKAQLVDIQSIENPRDWREQVLSTKNRLGRFLAAKGVRRFMGLKENNIDLMDIMDNGKILLVNLGTSDFLDRDAARVFASLLLNEFFETAMRRANRSLTGEKPKPFVLYLDEFQQYITDDLAAMLEEVLKGGLQLSMAHQHLGQFEDNPRLEESVLTNARIRAVFGGQSYESACKLGNEMFLDDLNTRQIQKAHYHTIHLYREETRTVLSRSSGHGRTTSSSWSEGKSTGHGSSATSGHGRVSGAGTTIGTALGAPTILPDRPEEGVEGWFTESQSASQFSSDSFSEARSSSDFEAESFSEGGTEGESDFEAEGESVVPVWVPIPVKELAHEETWSREEKLSKVAEMLKCQQQRHCFIKLDLEKTQPLLVPLVRDRGVSPESLLEYQEEVYKTQGALPAAEVDKILAENEQKFLAEAKQHILNIFTSSGEDFAGPATGPPKRRTPSRRQK